MGDRQQAMGVGRLHDLLLQFERGDGWLGLNAHAKAVLVHELDKVDLVSEPVLDKGFHVGTRFELRP